MKTHNLLIDQNTEDNLRKKKLAKCIIDLESQLNLSREEVADRSKIPLDKLLLMENADLSFSIEDYANVARNLAIMLIDHAIDELNRNLSQLQ